MIEAEGVSAEIGHDITTSGPVAKPDYGRGATFTDRGDLAGLATREQIESIFQTVLDEAIRYRQAIEPEWIANYQQYHGQMDDDAKAEWQSQAHVPKAARAINTATSRILSVLFGQDEWFSVKSDARGRDPVCERAKKMVLWQFDKAQAQHAVGQAIKDSMICGTGVLKVHVENAIECYTDTRWKANKPENYMGQEIDMGGQWAFYDATRSRKRLRVEPPIPTDYWKDPTGLGRYQIIRSKRTLSDVWALARDQKGDDGKTILRKAVYDPDVVKMIRPGARDSRLDTQAAIIRRERILNIGEQSVDVYEFWGDLPDPATGVTLFRNILATFVDKRWCVRMPQRNPFLSGQSLLAIHPILLPHQIYGYGLVAQSVKLQFEIDRVLQTMIDKVHLSVGNLEADPSRARRVEDFAGGNPKMTVGKIWLKKSGEFPIFTKSATFDPPNEWEIQLYGILTREYDSAVGVNEFATGETQTTKRMSGKEVEMRAGVTQQSFNEAAQFIEQTALTPLVNMVYRMMVQFEDDYDDPGLLDMFQDSPADQEFLLRLKGMSLAERWRAMRVDTEFKVNGITQDISRNAELQRLQQFLAMIAADPTLSQIVDKPFLVRKFLQLFNLPGELVLENYPAMLQAAQQAMVAQAGGQMAPGQPGPQGGATAPAAAPGQITSPLGNAHNRQSALAGQGHEAMTRPVA